MTTPTEHPAQHQKRRAVPGSLRVAIPAVLILVWVAIGGIGGPYFGKISQVSSNDATSYLPSSSDAAKVQNLEAKFSSTKAIPAVVVFVRKTGLSAGDE